ncbi:MAG: zinc-binding dehydrogenase [Candidatus Poribacteria bacterium]|nr:zinc-binding dehydrogenase [Candidatus Poribacteria bacterium]
MPLELVATAPRTPVLREYEERALNPNEVRVKSEYGAFKHGTELIEYRGESPFVREDYDGEWQMFVERKTERSRFPMGLGNMTVGIVTEIGGEVSKLKVGDRVYRHTGFREMHVWSENTPKLPDGMSWEAMTCHDPLSFAIAALRDGQVRLGDAVAVFGLGAIGLMIAQCARLQGAELVVVVDPILKRRELALKHGADEALDPTACDAGAELRKLTNKRGVDVSIEVSGNYRAMQQAIRGVAFGGNVVAVAYPSECKGGLNFGREAHFNIPNLIFARGCSDPNRDHPRWSWRRLEETAWRMLENGMMNTEGIVDPIIPFAESAEGFKHYADEHPEDSVKLGVKF